MPGTVDVRKASRVISEHFPSVVCVTAMAISGNLISHELASTDTTRHILRATSAIQRNYRILNCNRYGILFRITWTAGTTRVSHEMLCKVLCSDMDMGVWRSKYLARKAANL